MDPRRNPYTPNAGARPPVLVGRDDQLETFDLLLGRLTNGYSEQSMIITGLRGVGKTVLLGEFRARAMESGWAVVELEISKHDDSAFRAAMARETRRALFAISPSAKWREKARRAAAALKAFTINLGPDGSLSAGLNVDPIEGLADSGALGSDLTDVFVSLGEAALDHQAGVVVLLDEIQFLSRVQLEAVIAALHRVVQRALPVTVVAAGLPQIPELAGEAKSYSERLFKFPAIGSLTEPDARAAILRPAEREGVEFDPAAIDEIVSYTEGYPYFLQEYGKAVWDIAASNPISRDETKQAAAIVEEKLDSSFFKVRLDRSTEMERAYLRAMAELGKGPQLAGDVASLIDRTSQQAGPIRSRLIEKGLLYTPNYGYASFTVPKFDEYMKRSMPLSTPGKKPRR